MSALRRSLLLVGLVLVAAPAAAQATPAIVFTRVSDGVTRTQPLVGETVQAASDATGTFTWDLDGDGACDDATTTDQGKTSSFVVPSGLVRMCDGNGGFLDQRSPRATNQPPQLFGLSGFYYVCPGATQQVSVDAFDDEDAANLVVEWDDDGDGFDDGTGKTHTLPGGRQHTARVRVRDRDPGGTSQQSFQLGVPAPQASSPFTTQIQPLRRQEVTFTSSSSGGQGNCPATIAWDLDGNGDFLDATGPSVTRAFPGAATPYTVQVRSDDGAGPGPSRALTITTQANRIPTIRGTTATARDVLAGERVTLDAGTVADVDGDIAAIDWDLDGDGAFNDATGQQITVSPTTTSTPRVRVTDDLGGTITASVPTQFFGPASLAIPGVAGILNATFGVDGRPLNDGARVALRKSGSVRGLRLVIPSGVQNTRSADATVTIAGPLAKRLTLGTGDPVVIASGTSAQSLGFLAMGYVALKPTDAGRKLLGRLRQIPATVTVTTVDGFGRTLTDTQAVVLRESENAVRGGLSTTAGSTASDRAAIRRARAKARALRAARASAARRR